MRPMKIKHFFRWLVLVAFQCAVLCAHAAAPTIGTISNQTVVIDRPTDAIHLTVADAETAELSLILRGLSSNTNIVTTNNIFFGVAFNTWYLTVTPTFGQTGTSTISIIVRDGAGEEATNSFTFIANGVPAGKSRFAQPQPIIIPGVTNAAGPASPYPSINNVSGMSGWITNMNLTFSRLSHARVQDVNMLLVHPNGTGIVIFSEICGQNRSCTNTTITLEDGLFYPLPPDYDLWSEPLRPANFQSTNFYPGATWTNLPGVFASFNGTSPNGDWKLYVYDDAPGNNGLIQGGWSLLIGTSTGPVISDLTNLTIQTNASTGPLAFVINDPDTALSNLVLTASSSNTNLVFTNNIVFGGSGTNRTVTVTPNAGQSGLATITITVSDGVGSASDTFVLTVQAGNAPPTIAAIPDKTTIRGRAVGPFNITVSDAETPVGSLVITGSSSDTNLVPNGNIITFNNGVQTLTVQPADGLTGTSVITVNVFDGINTSSTNFTLTVNAPGISAGIFDRTNSISIPLANVATPYPSTNLVSGLTGTITNLTLTLKGLTHGAPHDLEMLLVGPGGQKAVFFSHVSGGTAANLTVTVDDAAFYQLPPSPYAILTGTYKSADFSHGTFPSNAPAGPYGTDLSPFLGTPPAGDWLLYVLNDPAGTGSGTLAQGWSLYIATDAANTPPIATNLSFVIPEDTTTNLVLVGSDAGGPVTFAVLQSPTNGLLSNLNTNTGAVTYRPATNYFGPDFFTYRVSDGGQFATGTVSITVSAVNDAPVATSFGATLPEDTMTNLTLLGSDVESAVTYGTVSNPAHGTLSGFNTNTGVITYKPLTNYFGSDTFNYWVSDGSRFATGTVSLTVSPVDDPAVANNQSLTMPKDTTTNLVLTASDIDTTNTVSDVMAATVAVTPDSWTLSAGASKVAAVAANDGDTSFLLSGSTANTQQQFTLADPSHFQPGDIINSVTLRATCRRNSTPAGNVLLTAVLAGNTSAGAAQGTGSGYAEFSQTFATRPGGGAWTLADVQNLEARIQNTQTRDVACTRFDALVSFVGNTNRVYAILNAPAHGTLGTLNTNNGAVSYTPGPGYAGPDSFTFTINAGGVLSTGLVSIVVTGPPSGITIDSIVFLDASHVRIAGTGAANVNYQIQASTDLRTWQTLGTALADGTGAFQFTDGAASAFTARFYRIALP